MEAEISIEQEQDDGDAYSGAIDFTAKSFWQHSIEFFKRPVGLFLTMTASFGVLWTFGEAAIQFTDSKPRGWQSYGMLILASLIIAIAWNVHQYFQRVPEGFERESRRACRLAHLQRPKWESKLALLLLEEKLGLHDRELSALNSGRLYIYSEKPATLEDYNRWLNTRVSNMFEMLRVAMACPQNLYHSL